jgi:hypothetical protein
MVGIKNDYVFNYMSIVEEEDSLMARNKTNQLIDILAEEGFRKSFFKHWTTKKYLKQRCTAEINSISRIPWFGRKYIIISVNSEEEMNPNDSLIQKIDKWAKQK